MEPAVEYKINWHLLDKDSDAENKMSESDFIQAEDIQIRKDRHGWYCSARSVKKTYFMICQSKTFDEFLDKMLSSVRDSTGDGKAYIKKTSVCAEADNLAELGLLASMRTGGTGYY